MKEKKFVSIGARIVYIRRMNRMTQTKLSELTGIHQQAISAIENGRINVRIGTLEKICSALGAEIDIKLL